VADIHKHRLEKFTFEVRRKDSKELVVISKSPLPSPSVVQIQDQHGWSLSAGPITGLQNLPALPGISVTAGITHSLQISTSTTDWTVQTPSSGQLAWELALHPASIVKRYPATASGFATNFSFVLGEVDDYCTEPNITFTVNAHVRRLTSDKELDHKRKHHHEPTLSHVVEHKGSQLFDLPVSHVSSDSERAYFAQLSNKNIVVLNQVKKHHSSLNSTPPAHIFENQGDVKQETVDHDEHKHGLNKKKKQDQ